MKTRNLKLRQSSSLVALGLAAVTLTACTDSDLDHRLITEATWKQNEKSAQPEVRRVNVQHAVAFAPQALDMTDVERESLGMFVQQNGIQPGSHVSVAAPTNTPTQAARARNRLAAVRTELQRMGISSTVVQAESTDHKNTGDEVVVFAQTVAILPPDCPGYNAPIALDFEWRPDSPLGCANAVNLGLMVANPSDLAQGRPVGPGDAEPLAAGVARYRASKTYPTSDSTDTVPFRVTTTSTQ
ncbi:MAG TPA: CpaD family pilus assembly lipoprotein [Methylomirabilota bacterium]|nr:CpaD family pilus assembly lipoprotein [Methylomirabilota bacterium]